MAKGRPLPRPYTRSEVGSTRKKHDGRVSPPGRRSLQRTLQWRTLLRLAVARMHGLRRRSRNLVTSPNGTRDDGALEIPNLARPRPDVVRALAAHAGRGPARAPHRAHGDRHGDGRPAPPVD